MKIIHLSDSHSMHDQIPIGRFDDVDMIIHSGDCSNSSHLQTSVFEIMEFLEWYEKVPVKYKILVAGNHDTAIERKAITKEDMAMKGIIYLENESIEIEGLKIWGSPITPTFGQWSFMKARDKTHFVWDTIPDDTDVVIVHGPPKGVRDLSYDRENKLEMCGDKSLVTAIMRVKPKLVLFGHIHNFKDIENQGVSTYHRLPNTKFSNASMVEDGKFSYGLTSFGNIFTV